MSRASLEVRKIVPGGVMPKHADLGPGPCGPRCARLFKFGEGKDTSPLVTNWINNVGLLPGGMVRMLKRSDQAAKKVRIPRRDRITWLKGLLQTNNMAILFVRHLNWLPLPLHWIVVYGMRENDGITEFLVYDSCAKRDVSKGHKPWTPKRLLKAWRSPFPRKSTAVVTP